MSKRDDALSKVTEFYLNSGDFNGLPIREITHEFGLEREGLENLLTSLIREGTVSLNFGDIHPNAHIKAFDEEPAETQIEKLQRLDLEHVCAYPTKSHLQEVVDVSVYQDRPFTLRLALGEAQLSFKAFDLAVLEDYRNDPRYYYTNNDISGTLSVTEEHFKSKGMPASDKVLLQTFGFAYDADFNRAVAAFLRYLAGLSPEHQQIWNAKLLEGDYKLHPDYYKITMGAWPEGISIFDAFVVELYHINEMCKLMSRPPLFKRDLRDDKKPKELSFLIRPTSKEYRDFVHTLDKAISENINRKFFQNEVPFEYEEVRKDGKVIVRQKGTILILDEWLRQNFTPNDENLFEEMINTFKEIRRLRNRPAHAIDDNTFDQKYFKLQRELIKKAYEAIRTLRFIFADHPNVKGYEIPRRLESGKIWIY
ncbi:MAG: AAA family ATPase [Candidatus Bipolaricaulia bacterium]